VAVAAALKADVCEIYTDVDGVYTTDPNICADARKLDKISFEEMLELASLGAKVLQIRSVEFGMKYGVRIHVRSSFNDNPGTIVTTEEEIMETAVVSGVAYSKNEAKITVVKVPTAPGSRRRSSSRCRRRTSWSTSSSRTSRSRDSRTLRSRSGAPTTRRRCRSPRRRRRTWGRADRRDDKIAKVSIVGMAMRSHSGVALKVFETLAAEGINILGSPPRRSRSPYSSRRSIPSWRCACSTGPSDWGNPPERGASNEEDETGRTGRGMKTVYLYDTTLRDGTQSEEISLSVLDKVAIAGKLDEFGIHYIEGGYPGSNPRTRSSSSGRARCAGRTLSCAPSG